MLYLYFPIFKQQLEGRTSFRAFSRVIFWCCLWPRLALLATNQAASRTRRVGMMLAACRRAVRARTPPQLARPSGLRPRTRQLSGEVASAAATGPIALAVEGLVAAQLHTGLPWWAAIGGSAIALRIALLPALWYQLRETRRFVALRPRFALLRAEVEKSELGTGARANAFLRGVWRTARAAGVQPLAVVGMPLLQLPLLIVAVLAARRLVLEPTSEARAAELRQGGTAWFADLTVADATKLLPIAAVGLTVANFQLAFTGSRNPLWLLVRDLVQAGCVVHFPFYCELPAGVFVFWVRHARPRMATCMHGHGHAWAPCAHTVHLHMHVQLLSTIVQPHMRTCTCTCVHAHACIPCPCPFHPCPCPCTCTCSRTR